MNGVAPALIEGTAMLPGATEALQKSTMLPLIVLKGGKLTLVCRNSRGSAWTTGRDSRDGLLDGQDWLSDEQGHCR